MFDESLGQLTDLELWRRIASAPLPAAQDGSSFADTLAYAFDLPRVEGRELEIEYRRFLYLVAVSDEVRVPPVQVRMAWQYHAHSQRYDAFCEKVLGKTLTLDDASRRLGATGAYKRTRAAYTREFGIRPPRMIWPEGIKPRLPRWLGLHALIMGGAAATAYAKADPMILAIGLFLSLGIYAFDLYVSFRKRHRHRFGEALNDDLAFFLKGAR